MDFKKAFVSVFVAFFAAFLDEYLFGGVYLFVIPVIILLCYFLMVFFEIANLSDNKPESSRKEADISDIPFCNVMFFKHFLKKKVRDYEKNRFLVSFVPEKIKSLEGKKVDLKKLDLSQLEKFYNLDAKLRGFIFAKQGFFEKELKNFFDYLDQNDIKYKFSVAFDKSVGCRGFFPLMVEVDIPSLSLTERQFEIILSGEKYTGRAEPVRRLFKLRKIVEDAGGFFVLVKTEGTKVVFGFCGIV